jgi:hypothetical protein
MDTIGTSRTEINNKMLRTDGAHISVKRGTKWQANAKLAASIAGPQKRSFKHIGLSAAQVSYHYSACPLWQGHPTRAQPDRHVQGCRCHAKGYLAKEYLAKPLVVQVGSL